MDPINICYCLFMLTCFVRLLDNNNNFCHFKCNCYTASSGIANN